MLQSFFRSRGRSITGILRWLHEGRTDSTDNARLCTSVEQRHVVRKALRYLSIKSTISGNSMNEFLNFYLSPKIGAELAIKFFCAKGSMEFTRRWCQPSARVPYNMQKWELLILIVVTRHYEVVTSDGLGYDGSTWRRESAQSWRCVKTVSQSGRRNVVIHRHDSIFKDMHVN